MNPMFHLAFPINNIDQAKVFYVEGLGCKPGRETPGCLILNLQGHQLVAHITKTPLQPQGSIYPRHFGLIFAEETDWQKIMDRVQDKGLKFYQAPKLRFPNSILEHRTFFLEDPFYNLLEFKFYRHPEAIFGAQDQARVGD
jgi:extradiol dioxygenase family protein